MSCRRVSCFMLLFVAVTASAATVEQRKAWADTIQRMRVIAEAIELYSADHGGALPTATTISGLAKALAPAYVAELPRADGWGQPFQFSRKGDAYRLSSTGSETGEVVLENGQFVTAVSGDHLVPWEPFDAPLARLSGKKPNLARLARMVNAQKSRLAMADMRTISTAVEAYATDNNHYPIGHTIRDLARQVEPRYIRELPRVDPWLLPYYYASDDRGKTYEIWSSGSDLKLNHDEPEAPETTADAAKDCIISNGEFLRRWEIGPNAAAPAKPVKSEPLMLPSTQFPIEWSLDILQDGAVIPQTAGVVTLKREPFVLRLTLPEVLNVRLNALGDDRIFKRMQPGFDFKACRQNTVVFCNGTGLAEEDGNPEQRLVLSENSMHYLTPERWNRAAVDSSPVVLERDVAMLGDTPIQLTTLKNVYIVAYVPTGSELATLAEHEIRKVKLQFR